MLYGAEQFIWTLASYRICWIGGRVSGGKTSLSFKLAEEFLKKDYRLVTNARCCWADNPEEVQLDSKGKLKAVVVMDEGGIYFQTKYMVQMIASYPAKMDLIYIFPSFWPPARQAQVVTCQPIWNLKAAGVPLIVYKWRVMINAFEDKGWFLWLFPGEIYGVYSRSDPGDDSSRVVEWLTKRTEEFRKYWGHDDIQAMEVENKEVNLLADSADTIAEAASRMASIPIRRGRRR